MYRTNRSIKFIPSRKFVSSKSFYSVQKKTVIFIFFRPNNFEYDESESPLETLKLQSANDPNYLIEVLSQLRSRVPHAMEM